MKIVYTNPKIYKKDLSLKKSYYSMKIYEKQKWKTLLSK